jgi:hypothetical protein
MSSGVLQGILRRSDEYKIHLKSPQPLSHVQSLQFLRWYESREYLTLYAVTNLRYPSTKEQI